MDYPNFYENVEEARLRLLQTVVLYDGEPYYVRAITDHIDDGIFRMYIQPTDKVLTSDPRQVPPPPDQNLPAVAPELGPQFDEYMKANPKSSILRKQMNSPLFNRFRPFPLGMCNVRGQYTYYVERQPNRHTKQGLIASMLYQSKISAASRGKSSYMEISMFYPELRACILGEYPDANICLDKLKTGDVNRESVGFCRDFALVRGPIGMLFLAYKCDIVGALTKQDFSEIKIGKEFLHTKEAIAELNLFKNINY